MMPTIINKQVPVPPPAYHRVQARLGPALHIDALTLVTTLHLLTLCHLAVRLAHRRCPPPLPAGPGGVPRTYSEESLLLISLLRTLWRLSYQDMHDWLQSWPALALACGLPLNKQGQFRIPSKSQQCKRRHTAGAPLYESLFVLTVLHAIQSRLIGARDLIIDSAPILAWRRRDPDASFGHAPAHHPRSLLLGYRVHTLICRGSGLPLFFLLSPANRHDAPFAQPLLAWALRLYHIHPRVIRLDAAYWGLRLVAWIHAVLGAVAVIPYSAKRLLKPSCLQHLLAGDRMEMPRPLRKHQSTKDARVQILLIVYLVAHPMGFASVFRLRFVLPYSEASRGSVTVAQRSAIWLPSKRHCTKP